MIMIKRLLPLCAFLVLIVSVMAFPASAQNALPDTFVDVLPAGEYEVKTGDGSFVSVDRSWVYVTEQSSAVIKWNAAVQDIKFHQYYITIQMTGTPSTIKVNLNSSHSVYAEYIGHSDGIYQYRFTSLNSNINDVSVTANWSYTYTGNFNILSFYGRRSYSDPVNEVSYRFRYGVFNSSGIDYVIHSYGNYETIPNNFWYSGYYPNDELFRGELFLWIDHTYLELAYADRATILIQSICPITDFGFSIVDNATTTIAVLPGSLTENATGTVAVGDVVRPVYAYQFTADLSGFSLDPGYKLQFYASCDSSFYRDLNTLAVQFNVISIALGYPVSEIPWYQTMHSWINNSITSNTDRLVGVIGSLGGALDDPESLTDVNDIDNIVADKEQQAASIKDKMNSVSKPDPGSVSSSSVDVSSIISASSAPLVMSALTGGPEGFVVTLLLLVFTFALVGYIFFGKR